MTNLLWIAEWTVIVALLFIGVAAVQVALWVGVAELCRWRSRQRRQGVFGRHWGDL